MDYSNLLKQLTQLNDARLNKLTPAHIHCGESKTLQDKQALFAELEMLGQVTGWLTWPDRVENITQAQCISPSEPMPPLEGELLTANQQSVRLIYRDHAWQLITFTVKECDATQANALMETVELAHKDQRNLKLTYQRIWQHSPQQGFITTDAIFKGFTGGNS